MRGEDVDPITVGFMQWGSPPHARGRLGSAMKRILTKRITPACAGKTVASAGRAAAVSDHPRMRGEDAGRFIANSLVTGSPPHARGRLPSLFRDTIRGRITPACAGKTSRSRVRRGKTPDHPRMRGEDRGSYVFHVFTTGSPPHARGRHPASMSGMAASRITPACAGKTCLITMRRS